MRIIAGTLRGRRLMAPHGAAIRPTADRARGSLFNMLAHGVVDFTGATVADICAGTGALGLEALSRGAAVAVFVDQNPAALELVRRNAENFKLADRIKIMRADARRLPKTEAAVDVVFADPPYRQNLLPHILLSLRTGGWLKAGTVLALEAGHDEDVPLPPWAELLKERDVGEAKFVLAVVKTPCF